MDGKRSSRSMETGGFPFGLTTEISSFCRTPTAGSLSSTGSSPMAAARRSCFYTRAPTRFQPASLRTENGWPIPRRETRRKMTFGSFPLRGNLSPLITSIRHLTRLTRSFLPTASGWRTRRTKLGSTRYMYSPSPPREPSSRSLPRVGGVPVGAATARSFASDKPGRIEKTVVPLSEADVSPPQTDRVLSLAIGAQHPRPAASQPGRLSLHA